MESYKYLGYKNEDLVHLAENGDEDAYEQLFYNLKPLIIHLVLVIGGRIPIYDMDDYLQEGYILIWEICKKKTYGSGNFAAYFYVAARRRFNNLYFRYCCKNYIVLWEKGGDEYNVACLGVSSYWTQWNEEKKRYMKRYRIEHRDQINEQKRNYWKKLKYGELEKYKLRYAMNREKIRKQHLKYYTEHKEEIIRHHREYYAKHKEEINARRRELDSVRRAEINARQRAYRAAHRDELNASRRERDSKRRDEINARQRAYRAAHRDELNARRRKASTNKQGISCKKNVV